MNSKYITKDNNCYQRPPGIVCTRPTENRFSRRLPRWTALNTQSSTTGVVKGTHPAPMLASLMIMVPPLTGTSSNFTYRANARTPPKVCKPSLAEGRPPALKPVLTEANTPDSPATRTLSSPVPSVLSENAGSDRSGRV